MVNIVLKETSLENDIRIADLVVTGEGRLDGQTILGKAPIGVAGIAQKIWQKCVLLIFDILLAAPVIEL